MGCSMSLLNKVPQSRVLADWVTDSIREAILRGQFGPGERLDQDLIATELQISRTPVREALSKLEAEGYVQIRPHRGAFVILPSPQEIEETYDVLSIIESEIVRRVTPMIPESRLCEMDQRLTKNQEQLRHGDLSSYFDIDSPRFPSSVFDLIDNKVLREIMASLSNRIEIIQRLVQQRRALLADSIVEHRAILNAMQQRNAEQAAELTKQHLHNSAQRILTLLQEAQERGL